MVIRNLSECMSASDTFYDAVRFFCFVIYYLCQIKRNLDFVYR